MIRQVAAEALADAGFLVIEAASADEAVSFLMDPGYVDILVTDITMPGDQDGLDLAKYARERDPAMPVLVVSGYAVKLKERLSEITLPQRFLSKPYPLQSLVMIVIEMAGFDPLGDTSTY